MKIFYLLANGKIIEKETKRGSHKNMPQEIDGFTVLAGSVDKMAIQNVKKVIFCTDKKGIKNEDFSPQ